MRHRQKRKTSWKGEEEDPSAKRAKDTVNEVQTSKIKKTLVDLLTTMKYTQTDTLTWNTGSKTWCTMVYKIPWHGKLVQLVKNSKTEKRGGKKSKAKTNSSDFWGEENLVKSLCPCSSSSSSSSNSATHSTTQSGSWLAVFPLSCSLALTLKKDRFCAFKECDWILFWPSNRIEMLNWNTEQNSEEKMAFFFTLFCFFSFAFISTFENEPVCVCVRSDLISNAHTHTHTNALDQLRLKGGSQTYFRMGNNSKNTMLEKWAELKIRNQCFCPLLF